MLEWRAERLNRAEQRRQATQAQHRDGVTYQYTDNLAALGIKQVRK